MNHRRFFLLSAVLIAGLILFPALRAAGQAGASQQVIDKTKIPVVRPIAPRITDIKLKTHDGSMIALEILGSGFGSYSPTKRLYIDGIEADVNEVVGWADTKIDVDEEVFFEITKTFIWVDHTYRWEIRDGGKTISNVFDKRFLLELHGLTPSRIAAGAEFEVTGAGFGHPGDLVIGKKAVTEILSRTAGKIRARVPAGFAAGSYDLGILHNGRLISNTLKIQIGPAGIIRRD